MSRTGYDKTQNKEEDLLDLEGMDSGSVSDTTTVDSGSEEEHDARAFRRDARIVGGHQIEVDDEAGPTKSVVASKGSQDKHSTTESKGGIAELSAAQKAKMQAQAKSAAPTKTLEEARSYQEANKQQAKAKSMFSFLNFSRKATSAKGSYEEVNNTDDSDNADDSTHGHSSGK